METTLEYKGEVLTKRIDFSPAFDKRDPDPSKDYGIHGMEMRFYIIGKYGATQFVVYTNWFLVQNRVLLTEPCLLQPIGVDVGYHAYKPHYTDQPKTKDCHLLKGGCYYDGSSLAAESLLDRFIEYGEDEVWSTLLSRYDGLKEVEDE